MTLTVLKKTNNPPGGKVCDLRSSLRGRRTKGREGGSQAPSPLYAGHAGYLRSKCYKALHLVTIENACLAGAGVSCSIEWPTQGRSCTGQRV